MPRSSSARVGWVERSETHRLRIPALMGIASLHPSYEHLSGHHRAHARRTTAAMQFRRPKARGTPVPRGRYLRRRASCLPQFDVKTLGLGHSGVFFHWSNRMVVKAIRHGAAVDERASISAPPKQDNDGVIETSIPARLDCPALGRLSYPRRGRARHHLDSGRAGSHAGGRLVGRAEGKPDAAIFEFRCWPRQQRLSRGRRAGRAWFRLADGPDRAQETVLHHARALSHRDRSHRAVVERGELCAVSLPDRRGDRRRIYRDQFDDPGTGAGALSRLD